MSDTVSDNIELVRRVPLEAFNEGRPEVLDEVVAADVDDHGAILPGLPLGREGQKTMITVLRRAFPDLRNEIVREIASGDLVVQHIRSTGTMRGEFMGMQPTGRSATWDGVHIVRVRDGKIVEHWGVVDQLGMLQQLGLAQGPPAARAA